MGFLDKLLGRSKETAEGVGESAKDTGEKAMDTASDLGDKAKDTASDLGDKAQDAVDTDEGGSDVTESEHHLDEVRDQTMRDEGRMP